MFVETVKYFHGVCNLLHMGGSMGFFIIVTQRFSCFPKFCGIIQIVSGLGEEIVSFSFSGFCCKHISKLPKRQPVRVQVGFSSRCLSRFAFMKKTSQLRSEPSFMSAFHFLRGACLLTILTKPSQKKAHALSTSEIRLLLSHSSLKRSRKKSCPEECFMCRLTSMWDFVLGIFVSLTVATTQWSLMSFENIEPDQHV